MQEPKDKIVPIKRRRARAPEPAGRDRTFGDLGEELARISVDLACAIKADRLTLSEKDRVRGAFLAVNRAATELLLLEEEFNKLRVASLNDRCRCGWDRGSHLVEAPHLCEEDARCSGFVLATLDTIPAADA